MTTKENEDNNSYSIKTSENPVVDRLDFWKDRFGTLADEAKSEGFTVFIGLATYDPLKDESWRTTIRRGCIHQCIGFLRKVLSNMERE